MRAANQPIRTWYLQIVSSNIRVFPNTQHVSDQAHPEIYALSICETALTENGKNIQNEENGQKTLLRGKNAFPTAHIL